MPTYTQIGSAVTVGAGGAASIEFTSIPNTYTDLCLFLSTRSAGGSSDVAITFNTSGGSYSQKRLTGNGSTAISEGGTNTPFRNNSSGDTASTFANSVAYIPNYAGSTQKNFSVDSVNENNAATARAQLTAGLWDQTAGITKITLTIPGSENFTQYSTAYLYGVSNA
jgi:hypothetical protein